MCEVTPDLLEFLKRWEGVKRKAYLDVAQKLTIGCGHLVLPEDHLKLGDVITDARIDELLTKDVQLALSAVNRLVKVPINPSACTALISLTFNIGVAAFGRSDTLRRLNLGDIRGAADAIEHWNRVGGKIVQGLVNRRAAERALFLTGLNN